MSSESYGRDMWNRTRIKLGANQAFRDAPRKAHQGVEPGYENQDDPSDEPPIGLGIDPPQQGGENSTYYSNHPQAPHQPQYPAAPPYSSQPSQYSSLPQAYSPPVQPYAQFSSPGQQSSNLQQQSSPLNSSPSQQPSSSRQYSPTQQFSPGSTNYAYAPGQTPSTGTPYAEPRPNLVRPPHSYPVDASGYGSFGDPAQPRFIDPTYDNGIGGWSQPSPSIRGYDQPHGSNLQRSPTMHEGQYQVPYGRPVTPGQLSRSMTGPASFSQNHDCLQNLSQYDRTWCTICNSAVLQTYL